MGRYSQYSNRLRHVRRQLERAEDQSGLGVAKEWAQGMVQVMAESNPQGTIYWYPGIGWTRASAPGQPPAIQTGGYNRSITFQKEGPHTYIAGSPEVLGLWLEKGTSHMEPRPHVFEGYQRNKHKIVKRILDEWGKVGE